jgi:quaternary ammonium compound-resistance protein SugE
MQKNLAIPSNLNSGISMSAAWTWLVLAGVFEIGWPLGLKFAQNPGRALQGTACAVICMGISGWMLWNAQKQIPLGTAYAVWTGIGASGTFLLGILIYGDSAGWMRCLAASLIILGVILLKLAH